MPLKRRPMYCFEQNWLLLAVYISLNMYMWYKFVACFAIWLAAAQIRASSMQTELTKMIWNINVMLLRLAILNVLRILLGGGGGGTDWGVRQLCFQYVLTMECWQLACVILHGVSLLCRFQYGGTRPSLKKTFSCSKSIFRLNENKTDFACLIAVFTA